MSSSARFAADSFADSVFERARAAARAANAAWPANDDIDNLTAPNTSRSPSGTQTDALTKDPETPSTDPAPDVKADSKADLKPDAKPEPAADTVIDLSSAQAKIARSKPAPKEVDTPATPAAPPAAAAPKDEADWPSAIQVSLDRAPGPCDAIGFYTLSRAGRPAFGQIIWARSGTAPAGEAVQIDLDGADPSDVGFFVMPGAAGTHTSLADSLYVHFEYDSAGRPVAVCDGRRVPCQIHLSPLFTAEEEARQAPKAGANGSWSVSLPAAGTNDAHLRIAKVDPASLLLQ